MEEEKIKCLAHYLEVSEEEIFKSGDKLQHKGKNFLVLSWEEVVIRFKKQLHRELWDFDIEFLVGYCDHLDGDLNELISFLTEITQEYKSESNILLLSLIGDFNEYANALLNEYFENNVGGVFSTNDYQHKSDIYNYYIYHV